MAYEHDSKCLSIIYNNGGFTNPVRTNVIKSLVVKAYSISLELSDVTNILDDLSIRGYLTKRVNEQGVGWVITTKGLQHIGAQTVEAVEE